MTRFRFFVTLERPFPASTPQPFQPNSNGSKATCGGRPNHLEADIRCPRPSGPSPSGYLSDPVPGGPGTTLTPPHGDRPATLRAHRRHAGTDPGHGPENSAHLHVLAGMVPTDSRLRGLGGSPRHVDRRGHRRWLTRRGDRPQARGDRPAGPARRRQHGRGRCLTPIARTVARRPSLTLPLAARRPPPVRQLRGPDADPITLGATATHAPSSPSTRRSHVSETHSSRPSGMCTLNALHF